MKKTLMLLAAAAAASTIPVCAFAAGTQAAAAASSVATVGTLSAATQICNGVSGKAQIYGGSGNPLSTGATFIKTGFDVQCSNNVLLQLREVTANTAAVASGSLKGNQSFKGHSNGGAVIAHLKCTGDNDMCLTANVTTAMDAAVLESSS
jgi:hypothetical protein